MWSWNPGDLVVKAGVFRSFWWVQTRNGWGYTSSGGMLRAGGSRQEKHISVWRGKTAVLCRRNSRSARKHMPSMWRTPMALPVAARGHLDMDQYQIAPNLGWGIISTCTMYTHIYIHIYIYIHTPFCSYLGCEPKGSRVFVHLHSKWARSIGKLFKMWEVDWVVKLATLLICSSRFPIPLTAVISH